MKRTKIVIGLAVVLAVSGAMTWSQVYPIRWQDQEPLIPAVAAGSVAIGDGGLGLNPDTEFDGDQLGPNAYVEVIPETDESVPVEERCTKDNRGEVRLKVLKFLVGAPLFLEIDAICHCAQKSLEDPTFPPTVVTYQWVCFHSGTN